MNPADLFAFVAATCNIAMVWPQAVKTVKFSNLEGVSVTGWWVNLALFTLWSVYAMKESLPILFVANMSCAIASVVILVNVKRHTSTFPLQMLIGGLFLTVAGAGLVAQSSLIIAALLLSSPFLSRTPHIISAIRATDYAGFSTFTWLLTLLTASLWMVSHILAEVELAVIVNATSVLMTVVLLVVVAVRRRNLPIKHPQL